MPHDISLHKGLLAQQVGMVAKIQTAFRHLIRPRASRAKPSSSARLWATKCAYSPECVEWAFSEVRTHGVLRSSALSWCSEVFCAMAHIHSPHTGVCCLRYVASRLTPREGAGQLPVLLLDQG